MIIIIINIIIIKLLTLLGLFVTCYVKVKFKNGTKFLDHINLFLLKSHLSSFHFRLRSTKEKIVYLVDYEMTEAWLIIMVSRRQAG